MNPAFADLPFWISLPAAVLVLLGSLLTLTGAFGLVRLRSFPERIHAPTLGTSWGTAAILLAAILVYSAVEGRLVVHALVIGVFVMITTPVTLLVLGRAALRRDRAEAESTPDES